MSTRLPTSIVLLTPTYGDQMYAATAMTMMCAARWCDRQRIRFDAVTLSWPLLAHARAELVRVGLARGATHLLFLDSDVEVRTPDWIGRLLATMEATGAHVVAGVYRAKPGVVRTDAIEGGKSSPIGMTARDGRTRAGAGCMLIRSETFERLPAPWFGTDADPATGVTHYGEDIVFCEKVQDAGMRVALERSSETVHYGPTGWHWAGE